MLVGEVPWSDLILDPTLALIRAELEFIIVKCEINIYNYISKEIASLF